MITWADGRFPAARRPVRGHWIVVGDIVYTINPGSPFRSTYFVHMGCRRCGTEWRESMGYRSSLTRTEAVGLVERAVSGTRTCEDSLRLALASEVMGS